MTKMYVMKMDDNWNSDYVCVCKTLKDVAEEVFMICEEEEGYFPTLTKKELIANMKQREKEGYIELLDNEDIYNETFLHVTATCNVRGF